MIRGVALGLVVGVPAGWLLSEIRRGWRAGYAHGGEVVPPFAPELVDAPLPAGLSGSPTLFVVGEPLHESTLPMELDRG